MLSTYLDEQWFEKLQLYKESPVLYNLNLNSVELPCQYTRSPDYVPDIPVYLDMIGSEIEIVRRQGSTHRRFKLFGSNGHISNFILQFSTIYLSNLKLCNI